MSIALLVHVLLAVIWVGGMFFAYMCLRPVAATLLEPPIRVTLWTQVFSRFFPWVFAAVILLPLTGHGMIAMLGGMAAVGIHVHLMLALGYVMIAIFLHVFFAPFKRMKQAVAAEDWPSAGASLNQIRKLVGINTLLGVITVGVAAAGRFIF
jgi:uncharacterized membrane protein